MNQRAREKEWAIQSTQVLNFIPKMERAASEMQKENRGYLLSGDPAFIDSYKRATADFYTYHGYLSVLVGNEPGEEVQLGRIRERLERWIAEFADPAIDAKRSGQAATHAVAARQSESGMNEVRRAMEKFERSQIDIYKVRSAAAARERTLTTWGIDLFCAVAAGLMIVSSSYSFVLCRRQLRKLESADSRIRSVVDQILDGMITIDEKGRVSSMNPAAKRMFGYGENERCEDEFTRLVPKWFDRGIDESPTTYEWTHLAKRTGTTTLALGETQGHSTFPVEISLSDMIVDQQEFHVAMIRDITERKRFEGELAAEKKSLAVTLASIGDGVITTDLDGRIVVCNAAGGSHDRLAGE